jgi:hypothetical protein
MSVSTVLARVATRAWILAYLTVNGAFLRGSRGRGDTKCSHGNFVANAPSTVIITRTAIFAGDRNASSQKEHGEDC